MDEKKLENQFEEFSNLGKQNKNVDVGALMLSALSQKGNYVSSGKKRWAYIVSLGLPPLGLLFALKYYFSDEDDAITVAHSCVILTILAVAMFWMFGKLFLSGTGQSLDKIQQITPQEINNTFN